MTEAALNQGPWLVGDLRVDPASARVERDGVEIELPELSFRLLLALIRAAPARVSKDQLITSVWRGGAVSDETLTQRVRLLRQSLGDSSHAPRYIRSVRNFGYRLIAPVSSIGPEAQPRRIGASPKRIARLGWLAAAIVGLIALIAWMLPGKLEQRSEPISRPGLAVLPLANLSAGDDQDYLVDGIHDELISRLSQINGLSVVSRTSVLPYRNRQLGVPQIAEQLGVSHVLEGSIQVDKDRLRIQLQLVDGRADRLMWSEQYERRLSMENLFEVQSTIGEKVAQALQLELTSSDRARLVRLPTADLATYDQYLLGRHHVFQLTEHDLGMSVELLEPVVAADPEFAEAWAALGWAYAFQASGYTNAIPARTYPKALAAAQQALRLAPALADAHSLHADVLSWFVWDWAGAEAEYQATQRLNADNVAGYALFQSAMLRHEQALSLINRLLSRYPQDGYFRINAAWRYLNARRYDEALTQAGLSRGHADADSVIGWARLGLGDSSTAVEVFERAMANRPNSPTARSDLAVALLRDGQLERGRRELEELLAAAQTRYVPATAVAAIYFSLGQADRGFEWLQRALAERDRGMLFLQVDHAYDGFREDPRYRRLVAQLNFPSPDAVQ